MLSKVYIGHYTLFITIVVITDVSIPLFKIKFEKLRKEKLFIMFYEY